MTALSQKILKSHQVRKTKRQKQAFINLLKRYFPELRVQEGGIIKCRNLIIGDVETAEVILSAHYDTCSALPFSNFITPKKPLYTVLYSILIVLPILLAVLLLKTMLHQLSNNYFLHTFLAIAVYLGLLALFIIGPPNKHTANDNTSGVITLVELMKSLDEVTRNKVAFVLFDHEETGLIGSYLFKKRYKSIMQDKLLINFDCVSDGDYLLLAATKAATDTYGHLFEECFRSTGTKTVMIERLEKVYYPSDQAGFNTALAVAAMKHKPIIGYYMDRIHTNKDTVFDETNIKFLCDSVQKLAEKL